MTYLTLEDSASVFCGFGGSIIGSSLIRTRLLGVRVPDIESELSLFLLEVMIAVCCSDQRLEKVAIAIERGALP